MNPYGKVTCHTHVTFMHGYTSTNTHIHASWTEHTFMSTVHHNSCVHLCSLTQTLHVNSYVSCLLLYKIHWFLQCTCTYIHVLHVPSTMYIHCANLALLLLQVQRLISKQQCYCYNSETSLFRCWNDTSLIRTLPVIQATYMYIIERSVQNYNLDIIMDTSFTSILLPT